MEEILHFIAEGDYFVSDTITGGASGCFAFQLTFEEAGSNVVVEYSVFEEMGWGAASQKKASTTHADIVSGAVEGISVRIRTDREPVVAKYKTI